MVVTALPLMAPYSIFQPFTFWSIWILTLWYVTKWPSGANGRVQNVISCRSMGFCRGLHNWLSDSREQVSIHDEAV